MDPRLLMDLADSLHRERVARVEARGWQIQGAPSTGVACCPREALALALITLAPRLAPSGAALVRLRVPGIPRA